MINLKPLKYSFESLEPVIDAKTMEIHWGRHHQAYVDNLNKILDANSDLQIGDKRLEEMTTEEMLVNCQMLPDGIKSGLINNAGGDYNHCLWWEQLTRPRNANQPSGGLEKMIENKFGGFESFWEEIIKSGLSRFGSGWVWLVLDTDGSVEVMNTANQENPIIYGKKPLLGIDVWEHAYYLKYQNRRADYLKEIKRVINWKVVEGRSTNKNSR